jgi:hypothetical protein
MSALKLKVLKVAMAPLRLLIQEFLDTDLANLPESPMWSIMFLTLEPHRSFLEPPMYTLEFLMFLPLEPPMSTTLESPITHTMRSAAVFLLTSSAMTTSPRMTWWGRDS